MYLLCLRPSPQARYVALAGRVYSKEPADLLAGNCSPLTVWRGRNISNRQCTSCEHLLVSETVERIHANRAIFGSGEEEVVLSEHQLMFNVMLSAQAYSSSNCGIILLTIIYIGWLSIRACFVDSDHIV